MNAKIKDQPQMNANKRRLRLVPRGLKDSNLRRLRRLAQITVFGRLIALKLTTSCGGAAPV
jgi:hypothetical protein